MADNQHRLKQKGKLAKGTWHHLALAYDGETMRFYLDGELQGADTIGRAPGVRDPR